MYFGCSRVDTSSVVQSIKGVLRRHSQALRMLDSRQTHILELGAFVGVLQHLRVVGFTLMYRHTGRSRSLRIKASSRGDPWNYSHVRCERQNTVVEVHSNLSVRGAHDLGVYCVDIAITTGDSVPGARPRDKWSALPNEHLKSFLEVKKLVVYPMLLAQFVGIVHEIRPEFLSSPLPDGFGVAGIPPPTLAALGALSGNSDVILKGFLLRGFSFWICPTFDIKLSACADWPDRSPFVSVNARPTPQLP